LLFYLFIRIKNTQFSDEKHHFSVLLIQNVKKKSIFLYAQRLMGRGVALGDAK